MISKIFGFGLLFALLLNVGFAQEESLIDEGQDGAAVADTSGEEDLFGGDFFNDLDSFLEQGATADEGAVDDPLMSGGSEDPVVMDEGILDPIGETAGEAVLEDESEDLQSSAMGVSGNLPDSAQVTLSVINISQDNADALQVGARAGDVLQYAISLNSTVEDVVDYVPMIDVSNLTSAVEFTNTGFGVLENGALTFPAYSHQAPCEQTFTFFVRVNEDCGQLTSLSASSLETGSVNVALNCGLTKTGPTQRFYLMLGLIMLVLALGFGLSTRSKTS